MRCLTQTKTSSIASSLSTKPLGWNSEKASYFFRTLLSENRICYETVEKTDEGLKSRVIRKPGPTGLITTTTAATLHPENETRLSRSASSILPNRPKLS